MGNRDETEEALEVVSKAGITVPFTVLNFHELPKVYGLMERGKTYQYIMENAGSFYPGEMQGRAVLRVAEHQTQADMRAAITPEPTTTPQFQPTHFNLGTRLAYRLEELGISDYFVVPGGSI